MKILGEKAISYMGKECILTGIKINNLQQLELVKSYIEERVKNGNSLYSVDIDCIAERFGFISYLKGGFTKGGSIKRFSEDRELVKPLFVEIITCKENV